MILIFLISTLKKPIEYCVNIPLFLQILFSRSIPRIWLLLSPQYLNYGDHLIALSELQFFAARSKKQVIDLNYTSFTLWENRIANRIKHGDIIWITGGGYLGDLWPESHSAAERVLARFPNNQIVFAPQSTFYSDLKSPNAKEFAQKVRDHGNCVFFSREQNTVDRLQELDIPSYLAPDFALLTQLEPKKETKSSYISFCLRDDHERTFSEPSLKVLKTKLQSFGMPFHKIVMAKKHCEIPTWSRKVFLRKKLREYSKSMLVVTDRLHGMLFCCVAGVPCIAVDNTSKKISGVYEWVKELDYIRFVASFEEADLALNDILEHSDKKSNRAEFCRLRTRLINRFGPLFDRYIV